MVKRITGEDLAQFTRARPATDVLAERKKNEARENAAAARSAAEAAKSTSRAAEILAAELEVAELRNRITTSSAALALSASESGDSDGLTVVLAGGAALGVFAGLSDGVWSGVAIGVLGSGLLLVVHIAAKRVVPGYVRHRGAPAIVPLLGILGLFAVALGSIASYGAALLFVAVGLGALAVHRRGLAAAYDLARDVLRLDNAEARLAVLTRTPGTTLVVEPLPREPVATATKNGTKNGKVRATNGHAVEG